jgi:hypothetical protein
VPEVIDEGITGFVVPGEAEAAEAIARLSELDRRRVRAQFEKRFTARRMAEEYVRRYQALVDPDADDVHPRIRSAFGPRSAPSASSNPERTRIVT